MKKYIHQFLYLLDQKARKGTPFLVCSFLLASCLDVVGMGLIGLFLGLITNPIFFLKKFHYISFLKRLSETELIIFSGILIVSAFATKAVLTLFVQSKMITFCQSLSVRLKIRMMTAFQYAPYTYHLQKNSSDLLCTIQSSMDGYVNNILLPVLSFISSSLIAIFILSFLLIMHPFTTGLLVAIFISLAFFYDLFAKKKLSRMGRAVASTNSEIVKNIQQGLHGLTEIRVLGRETYFLKRIENASREYSKSYGVLIAAQQVSRYLIENIIAIFIVGLSILGILLGTERGAIIATVGLFGAAGARLLPTMNQIMATINQIRGYSHHMSTVYNELIKLDLLNKDSPRETLASNNEDKTRFSQVQLNKVCYHYPQSNLPVLQNVNIEFSKGQSIGLIGPSGAGKSTLVNLILGFLEPQKGQLLVDGKPIQNLRSWLNNFAYIPQSIFILDNTLRRNIAFGWANQDIDDNKLSDAIKMAQLSEVVSNLPHGVETILGENGIRLSGGQRQRVALARAFYHERDIIVMDEATSALDNETEREVINTIKRLKGNKTLIVIAHRLTTVEHCDVLYRLEKGRVTAVGSFEQVVTGTV